MCNFQVSLTQSRPESEKSLAWPSRSCSSSLTGRSRFVILTSHPEGGEYGRAVCPRPPARTRQAGLLRADWRHTDAVAFGVTRYVQDMTELPVGRHIEIAAAGVFAHVNL